MWMKEYHTNSPLGNGLEIFWSNDVTGSHAVSTLKETHRMGELGGQTTSVSSWRLYL